MSLATRCPACGTVFRVVQDQLKVSEGWVRCGRCSEVFNAVDGLFDLDRDHAPGLAPEAGAAGGGEAAPQQPGAAAEVSAPDRPDTSLPAPELDGAEPDGLDAAAPPPAHEAEARMPADESPPPHAAAQVYAGLAPPSDQIAEIEAAEALASAYEAGALPMEGPDETDRPPTPEFIRRADRAARWRHPGVRAGVAALGLLLAASLAGQIALHYRDGLAANWPASRPWLEGGCAWLGCRIEAPRRIDALSVDSSGLVRIEGSTLYRLSLVLQNRSTTEVRMPAIDLALTDSRGQATIRRVLYVSELGHDRPSIAPKGELALQGTLDLGERRIAGYTVELFYP